MAEALSSRAMISVVIPTLNAETHLARTLSALVPAAIDGLVREVIIADGGSTDRTAGIANSAGATFIAAERGRGHQLCAGARLARSRWLLFLHADTVLQPPWEEEALRFMEAVDRGERPEAAGVFRFALDDSGLAVRFLEAAVHWRNLVLNLPYGDQGLLIPRSLYDAVGGFPPLALMEDVAMVRRLGRGRIVRLSAKALTSARRYRRDGYARRMVRNLTCLTLYYLKVPARYLVRLYG
jgi:rSAM/selenodomain-associated transferase 2